MGIGQLHENIKNGAVLIDFGANGCTPCKAKESIIKKQAPFPYPTTEELI